MDTFIGRSEGNLAEAREELRLAEKVVLRKVKMAELPMEAQEELREEETEELLLVAKVELHEEEAEGLRLERMEAD